MEAHPLSSELPKPSHPHRRLFYWGIGFWILAWIVTVCSYQEVELNVRGFKRVTLGVGLGSIICQVDDRIATSTKIGATDHIFLWSKGIMEQIRQGPGIMGILANSGWRQRAGTTYISFPIAGFLWLWLAAGWAAEIPYRRLARVIVDGNSMVAPYSRRRLIALTVALTALGVTVPYLATRARQASDKAGCLLNVRNIQQAVRGWSGMRSVSTGEPIVWGDLIGARKFLPPDSGKCPSGGDYQLSPLNPKIGELAARCPHPEHQRYILSKDTSDW